ncbi:MULTISPECIES: Lcl domain-containing protein [Nitrincola]|uniref:FHA domain-containing protein n=1 Tax=Nitrincola nitratireducens TaxID=1229521 RepID=W9UPI0_9GAMM|nr:MULTISPECIES: DUF1566 domain-containing protein [Nitrincola]EXJ09113.1 hypothetical protein D791_03943 [Nitrincola nitratireducens]
MPETTRIRIGRHHGDQVDLIIDNDAVSRMHAEAWFEPALDMVVVKDAGSVNGTIPTGDTQIAGDTLRVGQQGGVKVGEVELSYAQLKACIDAKHAQQLRIQQKHLQLENKKRNKTRGLVAVVMLAIIGVGGYFYSTMTSNNEATVEELTRALEQAQEIMRNPPQIDIPVNQIMNGSFVVYANGIATDTRSGLLWSRCLLGQRWDEPNQTCSEQPATYQGDRTQAAATIANQANYLDQNDWRVPTRTELLTLVQGVEPSVYQSVFSNDPMGFVWSSTVHRENESHWNVNFADAKVYWNTNDYQHFVRLVKSVN